jgi:hypothetical protein
MKPNRRLFLRRLTLALPAVALAGFLSLTSCKYLRSETEVTADCGWDAVAKAWLDKNQNGKWDPTEPPLGGVRFFVDDTLNHFTKVGRQAVSNHAGQADVSVWLPGCPSVEFEVYAKPPEGYLPTTPPRIEAKGRELFEFGFAYER